VRRQRLLGLAYRRRFFASAILRSPGGFGAGNGSGRGAGGSSFARIALKLRTAQVRLIVWCKACGHRAEPAVAEHVAHHGAGMIVIDWGARLRCQDCGERSADFVISGAAL